MRRRVFAIAVLIGAIAAYLVARAVVWDPGAVTEPAPHEPPLVTWDTGYEAVNRECVDPTEWTSMTTSSAWFGNARVGGTVTVCVDTVRMLSEADPTGDYYVVVLTSAWHTTQARAVAFDPGGEAAMIAMELRVSPGAIDNVYEASDGGRASPLPADVLVSLSGADVGIGQFPARVWGSAGAVTREKWDEQGATWQYTAPEGLDLVVVAYEVKVREGDVPSATVFVGAGT